MNYSLTRFGSIYVATNVATGGQYVGQTVKKLSVRVNAHRIDAQKPKFRINHAINTYGFESFIFEEVFVAFDKRTLDATERLFIKTLQPEYNMTAGGSGAAARKTSAEECLRRSVAAKTRWGNPIWRENTTRAIRVACQTPESVVRGKIVGTMFGGRSRWAGHIKKIRMPKVCGEGMALAWKDPTTRAKIIDGLALANSKPEVSAKRSVSAIGRKQSKVLVEKIARAKWKPVFCKEMQVSFLSQKHAAEYLGFRTSTIAESIKRKGKVGGQYTLTRVA
jgi:group I intron endonuclease